MTVTNWTIPIVTTVCRATYYSFVKNVTNMPDSVMTPVVVTITVMTTSDTVKNFPIFTVHFAIL